MAPALGLTTSITSRTWARRSAASTPRSARRPRRLSTTKPGGRPAAGLLDSALLPSDPRDLAFALPPIELGDLAADDRHPIGQGRVVRPDPIRPRLELRVDPGIRRLCAGPSLMDRGVRPMLVPVIVLVAFGVIVLHGA